MKTPDSAAVPIKGLWQKALADIGEEDRHDPDAITIHEFMALFGLSRPTAERRLRALVAAGKATETRKVGRKAGRRVAYVAYRLTDTSRARRPR
jgi:DNA-binding transcriptional ArsR family regulator